MIKIVGSIIVAIITSFYFYPFEITFLSGMNTKMIMAGLGLVFLPVQFIMKEKNYIKNDFLTLVLLAAIVSLVGLFSVVYNDTNDYNYATYLISMLVWMSAAYVAVQCMKFLHGYISVALVCKYLIWISVAQCFLALAIDNFSPLKVLVHKLMVVTSTMETRLYGVDASLDIAGSRFTVVLVMIVFLLTMDKLKSGIEHVWMYIGAFFVISIVGNMISRTTTVGVILSLCYLIYALRLYKFQWFKQTGRIWVYFILALMILIPYLVYKYNSSPSFQDNIRFAFEGFFSLAEKGRWEVHSNEMLKNMYVFPESFKTWIIGDGYFDNPYYEDPYYVGPIMGGYYMSTDVGYLRFIFYFGLIGLFAFMFFMYKASFICMKLDKDFRFLFFILLMVNYIVWFKVSTDIFLVFALFLCISKEENDEYNNRILLEKAE